LHLLTFSLFRDELKLMILRIGYTTERVLPESVSGRTALPARI